MLDYLFCYQLIMDEFCVLAGFCCVALLNLLAVICICLFFVIEKCLIFAKGTYQFYTGRYVSRCESLRSAGYGRGGLLDCKTFLLKNHFENEIMFNPEFFSPILNIFSATFDRAPIFCSVFFVR